MKIGEHETMDYKLEAGCKEVLDGDIAVDCLGDSGASPE